MNDHPYIFSWGGLVATITLTQINAVLACISAVVVIGYTLHRWYYLIKRKGKE